MDGKGAGALCTASVTALAVAADTSFCLQASLTAPLPGRLRRVELCRGANIIKTAVQNDFLLKGSATMNKEFSDSLWQFFCLLSSILLSDLVVPRPPGKSVRISNVFVDRNTTDTLGMPTSLPRPENDHKSCLVAILPPTACLLAQLPGVLR